MRWLYMASAAVIGILMFMTVSDVVRRAVTGKSLVGAVEVTEFLMVAIAFLAFAYTEVQDQHVKVTVLTDRLQGKRRAAIKLFTLLLGAALVGLILWQGTWDALQAWQIGQYKFGPGTVRLYTWPARFAVPFGSFWLLVALMIRVKHQVSLLIGKGD